MRMSCRAARFEQATTFLGRNQEPRRVLEVRHEVEELQRPSLTTDLVDTPLEVVEVDAVGLLPHADQGGLHVAEGGDRAGVAGQFDEHDVARVEEDTGDEVEPLLRTGRDHQLIGRRGDAPAGEQAAQGIEQVRQPARRPALQCRAATRAEDVVGYRLVLVPGEVLRGGVARRERDDVGIHGRDGPHLPDGGLLHALADAREEAVVIHDAVLNRAVVRATATSAPAVRYKLR